jgi:hypothetical protein
MFLNPSGLLLLYIQVVVGQLALVVYAQATKDAAEYVMTAIHNIPLRPKDIRSNKINLWKEIPLFFKY